MCLNAILVACKNKQAIFYTIKNKDKNKEDWKVCLCRPLSNFNPSRSLTVLQFCLSILDV